jgi:hypothetical protein
MPNNFIERIREGEYAAQVLGGSKTKRNFLLTLRRGKLNVCGFECRLGHLCLSLVSVVCCQVVSATG